MGGREVAEGPHLSGEKWSLAPGIGTLWEWVGGGCSLRDGTMVFVHCGKYDMKLQFILILHNFTYLLQMLVSISSSE